MLISIKLNITPERGESAFDVINRVERILDGVGLHPTVTSAKAEEPKADEVPNRHNNHKVYRSPLYPGTDEFHEFSFAKALT